MIPLHIFTRLIVNASTVNLALHYEAVQRNLQAVEVTIKSPCTFPLPYPNMVVYYATMSPAKLLHHYKATTSDGVLIEMVIWQLPVATRERPHKIKYRLYAGWLSGTLIVRYDNETGKGDHRHDISGESEYIFTDIEKLLADFFADIEAARASRR